MQSQRPEGSGIALLNCWKGRALCRILCSIHSTKISPRNESKIKRLAWVVAMAWMLSLDWELPQAIVMAKKKKKVTIKWNPKWMENLHLHKTYTWLLRTVIFTISPSQKQTKCSSNGEWTHQRMEHPHKEIPVSNKRQQIIDTCNHMAFQMHYAVWKESGSRGYTVWFPLYGIWKNESYGDRVITKGYGWGKGLTIKGDRQAIFFAIVVYLECGGSYMPPCIC